MNRKILALLCYVLFNALHLNAQTDSYAGTWQMQLQPGKDSSKVSINLIIGAAEKNMLYPAQLKVEYNGLVADYELLLVKKNIWQVAISRNKFFLPTSSLSTTAFISLLNGVFEYSKDFKSIHSLTLKKYSKNNCLLLIHSTWTQTIKSLHSNYG